MSKNFYAQLHLHTAESSHCGRAEAKQIVRACKQAGYDLIVITDHFFNANINCDFSLPWAGQVDCLMRGYRLAREEGERLGLTVLFGWETNTFGPEVLTYGLGEDFLLANPDVALWPLEEYARRCRAAGAFLCHAHPYREAYYIPPFTPQPEFFDAIEVFNAAHHPGHAEWDAKALKLAEDHNKIQLAGSDAHSTLWVSGGPMRLPWPVHTMEELIACLRTGEAVPLVSLD